MLSVVGGGETVREDAKGGGYEEEGGVLDLRAIMHGVVGSRGREGSYATPYPDWLVTRL